MSEINKTAVLQAVEHFNNPESREEFFQLYDDTCQMHGYQGDEPGIEIIKQFYRQFWTGLPDACLTVEDIICEGEKLVWRFRIQATHQGVFLGIPGTRQPVTLAGITILRFENGKAVERWSQGDFLGMLQQMGALPGGKS